MPTESFQSKPESHLINILKNTRSHHPNFALFLGAGTSVTSGVKSSREMIEQWRKEHYTQYKSDAETQEKHFKRYQWYNTPEEYSYLFEALYDQPSQRREFIESCIERASPSWGYIYLVNLIRNRVFNIVLTSNFDDLLNEACYQFSSDVRPIICAHDSSIRSLRIASKRPKIIKLHGDFLFDNIKNTLSELETLETNMREKLKYIAAEFGLLVVGYAGNDRSVMDALNTLLRNDTNFPHGIYWCIQPERIHHISDKLEFLTRFSRVTIIEIQGFDELFADIHGALDIELQPEIANPYEKMTQKLNTLLEDTRIPDTEIHPVINRDIKRLGAKLGEISTLRINSTQPTLNLKTVDKILVSDPKGSIELPIPYSLLSQIREREGAIDEAIEYILLQLKRSPRLRDFLYALRLTRRSSDVNKVLPIIMESLLSKLPTLCERPGRTVVSELNEISLELIFLERYDEAQQVLKLAYDINEKSDTRGNELEIVIKMNLIQIHLHKGEILTESDIDFLEKLKAKGSPIFQMGADILLGKVENAEALVIDNIKSRILDLTTLDNWPIFKLLPTEIISRVKAQIGVLIK